MTAAYYDYLKLPGYFILTFKMFDKSGKKTFKNFKKFVPESKNEDDDKLNFFSGKHSLVQHKVLTLFFSLLSRE